MKRYIVSLLIFTLCAFFLPVIGLWGLSLFYTPQLPKTEQLLKIEFKTPLSVYTLDGKLITKYGVELRTPIKFNEIPQDYINALLAVEDKNFFEHNGIVAKSLLRALYQLVRYRKIKSGGSTITMQAARNFFLNSDQEFIRKYKEILLALDMEKSLSKQQILELYVNKIFLGERAYGIASASQVYYGKTMGQLSLAQKAMIAGLPQSPSGNNPIKNPTGAKKRRNFVLRKMHDSGYITAEQYQQATEEPITAQRHTAPKEINAQHIGEMAREFVIKKYGDDTAQSAGLKVYTTILSHHQQAAEDAVIKGLELYDRRHGFRGVIKHLDDETIQTINALNALKNTDKFGTAEKNSLFTLLKPYQTVNGMYPSVVTEIQEDYAWLYSHQEQWQKLTLKGIAWAQPYIGVNTRGKRPKKMSDTLAVGDVVYTRHMPDDKNGEYLKLTQLPHANVGMVAIDPNDGAIKALVGSYNFKTNAYNHVMQATRQAGSTLKPFIYSSALAYGFTPASVFNDAPLPFTAKDAWRPSNSGNQFNGPMRLREALYRSRNLVSIRLMQRLSFGHVIPYLQRFGFDTTDFPRDLSLSLGSASIKPIEAVTAFSSFANGGYKIEPFFIHHITNNHDEIIFQSSPQAVCVECWEQQQNSDWPDQIVTTTENSSALLPKKYTSSVTWSAVQAKRNIKATNAYIMDSILKDVIRRGTATRAKSLGRSDLAGKTGTTNDQFDAWFTGYAPKQLAASVWVGFDTPATLGRGEFGGRVALPIWIDYMKVVLKDKPELFLHEPAGLVTLSIDPQTGLQTASSANTILEIFEQNHLPKKAETSLADLLSNTASPTNSTQTSDGKTRQQRPNSPPNTASQEELF